VTTYSISITLTGDTASQLSSSGSILYAFNSVSSSNQTGCPLVWYVDDGQFFSTTTISWSDSYQAYISTNPIAPLAVVTPQASEPISVSQIMNVNEYGNCTASTNGISGTITIQSAKSSMLTCGISETVGNGTSASAPICAFYVSLPIPVEITPVQKILLMFATDVYQVGAYMVDALGQGLLVDMSGATSREVSFDYLTGWSAGNATWAEIINFGTDLASVLIEAPAT
jgi:hypothetical protein